MSSDSAIIRSERWSQALEQWGNKYGKINNFSTTPTPFVPHSSSKDVNKNFDLYGLSSAASVQVTFQAQGSRYDKLKHAAEQMLKEQISTKTERDMFTNKLSALEKNANIYLSKIQKLRIENSQLQSLLQMEKTTINRLEFENKSLQVMLDTVNNQITEMQENIVYAKSDSKRFADLLEAYNNKTELMINENKKLVDQNLELDNSCKNGLRQLETVNEKFVQAEQENYELKNLLSVERENHKKLQADVENKTAWISDLQVENSNFKDQLNLANSKNQKLSEKKINLKKSLNQYQIDYSHVKAECENICAQLKCEVTTNEELLTNIRDLTAQANTLRAEEQDRLSQLDEKSKIIENLNAQISILTGQKNVLVESNDNLTTVNNEYIKSVSSLESEMRQVQEKNFILNDNLQELQAKYESVTGELKVSNGKLEESVARIEELSLLLKKLKLEASDKEQISEVKRKTMEIIDQKERLCEETKKLLSQVQQENTNLRQENEIEKKRLQGLREEYSNYVSGMESGKNERENAIKQELKNTLNELAKSKEENMQFAMQNDELSKRTGSGKSSQATCEPKPTTKKSNISAQAYEKHTGVSKTNLVSAVDSEIPKKNNCLVSNNPGRTSGTPQKPSYPNNADVCQDSVDDNFDISNEDLCMVIPKHSKWSANSQHHSDSQKSSDKNYVSVKMVSNSQSLMDTAMRNKTTNLSPKSSSSPKNSDKSKQKKNTSSKVCQESVLKNPLLASKSGGVNRIVEVKPKSANLLKKRPESVSSKKSSTRVKSLVNNQEAVKKSSIKKNSKTEGNDSIFLDDIDPFKFLA